MRVWKLRIGDIHPNLKLLVRTSLMSILILRTLHLTLVWFGPTGLSFLQRLKRVYPNLVLPLHHLPDFLRDTVEQGKYDDDYDVEESEVGY